MDFRLDIMIHIILQVIPVAWEVNGSRSRWFLGQSYDLQEGGIYMFYKDFLFGRVNNNT